MKEDKKKLEDARTKAAQKGPMGEYLNGAYMHVYDFAGGGGGIKRSGKK